MYFLFILLVILDTLKQDLILKIKIVIILQLSNYK